MLVNSVMSLRRARTVPSETTDQLCPRDSRSSAVAGVVLVACVALTVGGVGYAFLQRCELARDVSWQCDELPVIARFTSVGSVAQNELQAREFKPSLHSLRTGIVRSLRVPSYVFSPQTTTHLWTSLTLNLFGYSTLAGRIMPLVWGFVAIVGAGWATWLCVRSVPGVCFTSLVVAFSPAATAYSAQARGYGEAIALLPLMLVALELWRRKCTSWVRLILVAVITVQLSLTVYTMWVYWVFPVLIVAVVILPRLVQGEHQRLAARAMLVGLLAVMCIWMGIFTAERWKTLAFASTYGARFGDLHEFWSFVRLFAVRLIPVPLVVIPLFLVGVFRFRRTLIPWWGWVMPAGIAFPVVFAMVNGSPGFMRNLFYVLGPLAMVASVGFCHVVRVCFPVGRSVVASVFSFIAISGFLAGSAPALAERAYAFLLPDWGSVVRSIDAEPKTIGPRLICPCAANHWQINWYGDRSDDAAIASLSTGDSIEVVMGAQLDDSGQAVIFRHNKRLDGIRAEVLPAYLQREIAAEVRAGVALRRWRGTKVNLHELSKSDSPVLVLASLAGGPSQKQWAWFLRDDGAYDAGVVAFKERLVDGRQLHSMMIPSWFAGHVDRFLREKMHATEQDLSWLKLSPL